MCKVERAVERKNDLRWQQKYEQLKAYIIAHRHLPDKKKVENRGLLNWWKYNKKLIKQGKISAERHRLLIELGNMREQSCAGRNEDKRPQ